MRRPYLIEPIRLSREDLESENYKTMEALVQRLLTEEKVGQLCIHEAGHIILFEEMKQKASPLGPMIYHNKEFKLDYALSSISVPCLENRFLITYTAKKLAAIGKGAAAGGIFLEHFKHLPESEWGDHRDREQFHECCQWATRQDSSKFARLFELQWEEARDGVRSFLKNLTHKQSQRIEQAKQQVRKCFIPTRFLNAF